LAIEIDGYESVLEHWGEEALDTVIQVFAGYCVVVMRHCDSFGRLGPKRFLALLPETGAAGAMTLAQRMCRDLAHLDVVVDDEILNFTVTIGVAESHVGDSWAGDFMRRATQALDDAIESGRNTAVLALAPPHRHANDLAPMAISGVRQPSGQAAGL
jgi:diguanylate cyclase (GGDEF)-like protein